MFESLIWGERLDQPEEIAAVALFPASDDSSFVNGVELSVDGGLSAICKRRSPFLHPGESL